MDADLKKQAEELFSDLGMNLTTAFTIFAKQSVREQKLPFSVSRAYGRIKCELILHLIRTGTHSDLF